MQAKANNDQVKGPTHYEVAAAITKIQASLGCSKKEWGKAIRLLALELEDGRAQWKASVPIGTVVPPGEKLVQEKSANKQKGPKQAVPAPNPVKQSAEYKELEAERSKLVEQVKVPSLGAAAKAGLVSEIHEIELSMKILRGSPNAIASGGSASSSSVPSKLEVTKDKAGDPSSSSSVASFKDAFKKGTIAPAKSLSPQQMLRGPEMDQKKIEKYLSQDSILGFISPADRKSILNGLTNGLFHSAPALINRWEAARVEFERAAEQRVSNGGNRLM